MAAAVAGLVAVGLLACGPAPEPVEVADLVAELRYAEVARELPVVDLGTPSATGARAGGWSWNETSPDGATFAWAVGPRSELAVYLAWQRELDVRVRCRAFRYPGAPAQVVDVHWDDVQVASVELGAGFEERSFVIPTELATPGDHRLAFVPTYFARSARPAVADETAGDRPLGQRPPQAPAAGPFAEAVEERRGDQRKLSIACDWVAIGAGNGSRGAAGGEVRHGAESPPGAESASDGAGESPAAASRPPDAESTSAVEPGNEGGPRGEGETLWIPVGSEAAFFLEPEQDLDLRWDELSVRGDAGLAAVWEVEGEAPAATALARSSSQPLTLPGPAARSGAAAEGAVPFRAARLTLRAVPAAAASGTAGTAGDVEAGVVLRRPRLTSDGCGSAALRPTAERSATGVSGTPEVSDAAESRHSSQLDSILLWIIDTLRVDRLGYHGHEVPGAAVSPNLDALAARSTVFEQAIAQSSWTRPTVATLLTGVGPERHGIRELSHGMEESFVTLPEQLRELGYATAGFSANANVTADTGFAQGFDRFEYGAVEVDELVGQALAWLDELSPPASVSPAAGGPGEPAGEAALSGSPPRLPGSAVPATSPGDRSGDQPFFLMILSVEPHAAFAPAEPFRSRFAPTVSDRELGSVDHLRALNRKEAPSSPELVDQLFQLYDGEIAWNDHVFGVMRDALRERGHDPLVVVIADHGEAFEERGVFGHAWDLHREVLDIPFFIHLPGQVEGRRVRTPVQQADVLPTLMELAGGTPGHDVEGDSLAPLLQLSPTRSGAGTGESGSPAAALEDRLLLSTMDTFRRPAASLVRGRYKFIELRRPGRAPVRQLFDRVADPEERQDLAATRPILAGRLARLLREQVELSGQGAAPAPQVEVDEDTRRRLRALGYIE